MKILIVTQHIFPIQTPRSIRSTELIKELARRGHNVTVYAVLGKYNYQTFEQQTGIKVKNIPIKWEKSPYNSDGTNNRTFIDKVTSHLFNRFEFPLFEFYFRIAEIIKHEEQFDALISIAAPHHIHWGCAKAKKECPDSFPKIWIADCGDPFMKNGKTKDHLHFFAKYEHSFCKNCNYITVPVEEAIDAYYPDYQKKIKIIPQGFDFNLENVVRKPANNNIPTFAFAGMFYPDIRNPKLFLDYLSKIDKDFRFIVYTRYTDLLTGYKDILKERLIIKEPIQRLELIEELKKMDFLINIKNANCPNQIPSKLIDYRIANRPILDINPQTIDSQAIDQFLDGDYSGELIINNIENYHIRNVAGQFEELMTTNQQ